MTLAAVSCSALAAASIVSPSRIWMPLVGMTTILFLYLQTPSIVGASSPFLTPHGTR